MPGWLSSVSCGPRTWMHWSAISIVRIDRRQRNGMRGGHECERERYAPRPAGGAQVERNGETWTLRLLEYDWGDGYLRWELEASAQGTRLRLWHNIDRRFISMGAAGWHICLDVLEHLLGGRPVERIVGADAMKFEWPRLRAEYAK